MAFHKCIPLHPSTEDHATFRNNLNRARVFALLRNLRYYCDRSVGHIPSSCT